MQFTVSCNERFWFVTYNFGIFVSSAKKHFKLAIEVWVVKSDTKSRSIGFVHKHTYTITYSLFNITLLLFLKWDKKGNRIIYAHYVKSKIWSCTFPWNIDHYLRTEWRLIFKTINTFMYNSMTVMPSTEWPQFLSYKEKQGLKAQMEVFLMGVF